MVCCVVWDECVSLCFEIIVLCCVLLFCVLREVYCVVLCFERVVLHCILRGGCVVLCFERRAYLNSKRQAECFWPSSRWVISILNPYFSVDFHQKSHFLFMCFHVYIVILYIYVLMLLTIKQASHQHIKHISYQDPPTSQSESPLLWLFKNTTGFHKPPSKQMRHQHIKAIFHQHHWPWLSIRKCKSHTSLTFP